LRYRNLPAGTEETRKEIDRLACAIAGNPELYDNGIRSDFGYIGDTGAMTPTATQPRI